MVRNSEDQQELQLSSGQEAYFALLAQDMLTIAATYGRDIHEVHKIFYEVSCDRDRLIMFLKQQ